MDFNFRQQTAVVHDLLRVLQLVFPALQGSDRLALEQALRRFETTATVGEVHLSSVRALEVHLPDDALSAAEMLTALDRIAQLQAHQVNAACKESVPAAAAWIRGDRPPVGKAQTVAEWSTQGSGFVSLRTDPDGYTVTSARTGPYPKPVVEQFTTYAAARNVGEARAAQMICDRRDKLGATNRVCWIVVPKEGSASAATIVPRSAAVAHRVGAGVTVHFEGNLIGASNLVRYRDRLLTAASRLFQNMPTVARQTMDVEEFAREFSIVGTCCDDFRIVFTDFPALVAYCASRDGSLNTADEFFAAPGSKGGFPIDKVQQTRGHIAVSTPFALPDFRRVQ